jgi:hypothetical protein
MKRTTKRRLGGKVFHMDENIWRRCKECGVTASDVLREKRRYNMMGIDVTMNTAAAAALDRKTRLWP